MPDSMPQPLLLDPRFLVRLDQLELASRKVEAQAENISPDTSLTEIIGEVKEKAAEGI